MAKSSSNRWLNRQRRDPLVRQAKQDGWRSRAVYKLEQLDQREKLIRPGQRIVDLGCAPGGWSQYCLRRLKGQGQVLGIDLLEVEPIPGLAFLQADFLSPQAEAWVGSQLADARLDLVLSDMAPNLSGNRLLDQARTMELLYAAADFCARWLRADGHFLFKAFQGEDLPEFVEELKRGYAQVVWRKPSASRGESREVYVLARGRRMPDNSD